MALNDLVYLKYGGFVSFPRNRQAAPISATEVRKGVSEMTSQRWRGSRTTLLMVAALLALTIATPTTADSGDPDGSIPITAMTNWSPNLILNPGFEDGNAGWTKTPAGEFPATALWRRHWGISDEHSGTWAYSISNLCYGFLLSDQIPVSPNTTYDLYSWVRGEIDPDESTKGLLIRANFYDASGAYLGNKNVFFNNNGTVPTRTWQRVGSQITTPAEATIVRIALFNYLASGWIAFDDVEFNTTADPQTNLAPNPSFEDNGIGWTENPSNVFPATSFYRSTWAISSSHSGSYSYAISNLAYGYLRSDYIPVMPNTVYDLHSWIRGEVDSDESERGPRILVHYYDAAGTRLNGYQIPYSDYSGVTPTLEWQRFGGQITAPADTATIRIFLQNYFSSGWVAFDDVELIDPADPQVNLAPNPGFEDGNTGWSDISAWQFPATSVWRSTYAISDQHSGSYAWTISNLAHGYLLSDHIPVSPNTVYDFYSWVRGEIDPDGSDRGLRMDVDFYNGSGTKVGGQIAYSNNTGSVPDLTWQRAGGTITTPPEAATVRIRLFNYFASGWIAFDDVELRRAIDQTQDPTGVYDSFTNSPGFEIGTPLHGATTEDGEETWIATPNIGFGDGVVTDISGIPGLFTARIPVNQERLDSSRTVSVEMVSESPADGWVRFGFLRDETGGFPNNGQISMTLRFDGRIVVYANSGQIEFYRTPPPDPDPAHHDGPNHMKLEYDTVEHTVRAWLNGVELPLASPDLDSHNFLPDLFYAGFQFATSSSDVWADDFALIFTGHPIDSFTNTNEERSIGAGLNGTYTERGGYTWSATPSIGFGDGFAGNIETDGGLALATIPVNPLMLASSQSVSIEMDTEVLVDGLAGIGFSSTPGSTFSLIDNQLAMLLNYEGGVFIWAAGNGIILHSSPGPEPAYRPGPNHLRLEYDSVNHTVRAWLNAAEITLDAPDFDDHGSFLPDIANAGLMLWKFSSFLEPYEAWADDFDLEFTPNSSLEISEQPVSQSANEGETVDFQCFAAHGLLPYTFEWQKRNGLDWDHYFSEMTLDGTSLLRIVDVRASDAGSYRCYVSDSWKPAQEATSVEVDLIVGPYVAPVAVSDTVPLDPTAYAGGSVTFEVTASGGSSGVYGYYWVHNGSYIDIEKPEYSVLPLGGGPSAEATSTLKISPVSPEHAGEYYCKVIEEGEYLGPNSGPSTLTVDGSTSTKNYGPYSDVTGDHDKYAFINSVTSAKLMFGCGGEFFCPDAPVAREDIAEWLVLAKHGSSFVPPSHFGKPTLYDVDEFYCRSSWIEQLHFIDGVVVECRSTQPNYFCPYRPVSRAEITQFLLRTKHGAGYQPTPSCEDYGQFFTDVPCSHPFASWITAAKFQGIVGHCDLNNNRYCPDGDVTRAEMAEFLYNAFLAQ